LLNISRRSSKAAALVMAGCAFAQGPESVLLVMNKNVTMSREIGEYYSKRRLIPAENVCTIQSSSGDSINREIYNREVEGPVGACLEKLKGKKIHYIVTTRGVPLRVTGGQGMSGNAASVDSELAALYAKRLGRTPPLEGPLPNPFYRQLYSKFDQKRFAMYLVARLAAYDAATVKRMIDSGMTAVNKGNFVLDMKAGENENAGEKWLSDAALLLPQSRVVIDSGSDVLYNQQNVIGYAGWGSNDPNRRRRFLGFKWLPGSVATEFVSSNGRTFEKPPATWFYGKWEDHGTYFAGSPQSLAADYLDEGATAATGHSDEPFLQYTPRPDYLLPAYYSGRTLGESFYISIPALSWHNVLLGDPLCKLGPPQR
jgi:uncharacterized protein (TIGR03790 family)